MNMEPSRRAYAITVFLILLICYGYFMPKWADWGANSRANLVYAVGDLGIVQIDAYHENTGDKACFPGPYDAETDTCHGNYYTDKSLGPSLVALPFYMVFKVIAAFPPIDNFINSGSGLGGFSDTLNPEGEGIRPRAVYEGLALTFITFFAMSLPSAILGMVVFLMAARFASRDFYAFILALAYGLATIAFPYSNVLYQHQMAAFGTFVGFYLLWRVIYEGANRRWLWLVGVLFSLTVITEYPVVMALAIIFIWALIRMPDRLALYRVVLGAVPLGLIFAGFNYVSFQTIMPVGYNYSTNWQTEHETGFLSLTLPTLERVYGLTFSPVRGIFILSPFLLLLFPGFYQMWQQRKDQRGVVILLALVSASFFLYNSASVMWWGGFTVGPRYLVPMMPFLVLPIIFPLNWLMQRAWGKVLTGALVAVSFFMIWVLTTAGQGWPPVDEWPLTFQQMNASFPLLDYSLPLLAEGNIARNYGIIVGLRGFLSLIPLLVAVLGVYLVVPRWLSRRENHRKTNLQQPQQATGGTN